jgi:dolichol-phosphate mannosyltransferase
MIMISVILPTYNEAKNVGRIIPEIFKTLETVGISGEVIVVDDNSPDGTGNVAMGMARDYPVKVHVRKNERGLSTAVMKGFELAKGDIYVVMDADMSHPVEKLPEMVGPILEGSCDATVGSRYVADGGCKDWPLIRRVVSKGAGLLAKGIAPLSDPTSGFMAIRAEKVKHADLDPVGWKIVLETIVKTKASVLEVPIVFADRQEGESKLNLRVQIDYLRHLWRLYRYTYPSFLQFMKFCLVGLTGLFVDSAILISFVEFVSVDPRISAIFAFVGAVSWNYVLNRTWTFDFGKQAKIASRYALFVSVCVLGLGIRVGIMHLLIRFAGMGAGRWYILASIIGIAGATIFNFVGSKYLVFSRRYLRA